jgi:hypothetical protein
VLKGCFQGPALSNDPEPWIEQLGGAQVHRVGTLVLITQEQWPYRTLACDLDHMEDDEQKPA